MEMSGNGQALNDLLSVMSNGGKVALLGIPPERVAVDWSRVIFKGLVLKGIYGREMYETWYKMASMLRSGLDISPVITHRFHVDDFEKGFEVMRKGEAGKVILSWD
jgi:threonine 3-dehydrogenase